MWFKKLTGFIEKTPEQVRSQLTCEGEQITSLVNGKTYTCGRLEIPSLAELRNQLADNQRASQFHLTGPLTVRQIVDDVKALHRDAENSNALFQVASQFKVPDRGSVNPTPLGGEDEMLNLKNAEL